jgi:hypothetical protein
MKTFTPNFTVEPEGLHRLAFDKKSFNLILIETSDEKCLQQYRDDKDYVIFEPERRGYAERR